MNSPDFTVEVFQNEYLPAGGTEVNAIITVTSAAGQQPAAADAAEVIIMDCSGSMGVPMSKIVEAQQATAAALDVIRDGVDFAVVAGAWDAMPVYPADGSLASATAETRAAAKEAIRCLSPYGRTAIGRWLQLVRQILDSSHAPLRHAILLTDGQDNEGAGRLEEAIRDCRGTFTCDCRGVGTDWIVQELRKVSTGLLGTTDIVPEPAGLTADFEAMMRTAMGKELADVALQVRTPQQARIRYLKQVAPAVEDLTARRVEAGPQVGAYPTGAWGRESRDYHICVEVQPAEVGEEMLAARVSLVLGTASGPQVLGHGMVKAIWTDDETLSAEIDTQVAHYTGQAELAQAIQDGLAARKAGDEHTAVAMLGRAVALAHESGNHESYRLLAQVVDVVDAETGTIQLRARVTDVAERTLDTRSVKTVRLKR